MLSLAGGLLVEISLPKLIMAWTLLLLVPGLLLGLGPIVASEWVRALSGTVASPTIGLWSVLLLAAVLAIGYFGWRALFRLVEGSFWALNSVVVQPGYATVREVLRQIAERSFVKSASKDQYATLRAASALAAGLLICGLALLVLYLVYPSAELFGSFAEIGGWRSLIGVALANSVVLIAAYLAIAALIWGVADATMAQPRDLAAFDRRPDNARLWRVVHLSDVHVVGERYGFRIESGRSGPRGNERLRRVLNELETIHAKTPLDLVLITGDMTDAGTSAEWAEFLDALAPHPKLAERVLILPGNHDLNIVDRANPARMDLPTSPNRRLRQLRTLSAMLELQGDRVRVVDFARRRVGRTLAEFLEPHLKKMARFANVAKPLFSYAIPEIWAKAFPMVLPPDREDGLGVILFNSNADTHFSFTNALGMVSAEQVKGLEIATKHYPARLLDRRAPSPRRRIPTSGKGSVGAHRHGADQRQLVCASDAAPGRPRDSDARSPAYRLDRPLRGAGGGVGAVAGDGGDRRRGHRLLHSYARDRDRRAPQAADAGPNHGAGRASYRFLDDQNAPAPAPA